VRAGSGRVKARDSYHHGDLRRALVDTAVRLMAEQGADGFTLRETARAVGVSHAAAYRHFADKEDVLSAIAAHGYRELRAPARSHRARAAGARGAAPPEDRDRVRRVRARAGAPLPRDDPSAARGASLAGAHREASRSCKGERAPKAPIDRVSGRDSFRSS
jgi:AcrR family transcriptional regulator